MQNLTNCATVWSSERRAFVGILSISDFLEILHHVLKKQRHNNANRPTPISQQGDITSLSSIEDIARLRIVEWQAIMSQNNKSVPKLLTITPESTILETIRSLVQLRVHRLAVCTNSIANTVLCVLSQHRVLAFILCALKYRPDLLKLRLQDLGLGVYGPKVMKIAPYTSVTSAIDLLLLKCVSSLPVVWNDVSTRELHPDEFNAIAQHLPPPISPETATPLTYLGLHTRSDIRVVAANEKYMSSETLPTLNVTALLPNPLVLRGILQTNDQQQQQQQVPIDGTDSNIGQGNTANTTNTMQDTSDSSDQSHSSHTNMQQTGNQSQQTSILSSGGNIGPTSMSNPSPHPDTISPPGTISLQNQILEYRRNSPCCMLSDTIYDIFLKMYTLEKHQLVCVDQNWNVSGIVAITDFFCFILQTDLGIPTQQERMTMNTNTGTTGTTSSSTTPAARSAANRNTGTNP